MQSIPENETFENMLDDIFRTEADFDPEMLDKLMDATTGKND
jgi:hypothetical protein